MNDDNPTHLLVIAYIAKLEKKVASLQADNEKLREKILLKDVQSAGFSNLDKLYPYEVY